MQEPETTQKPRVQYSLLDLMAVVLIFASHMALMTQHFLAGVGYALGYTCFALGFTLVLFIVSQRKIEAARAFRPVAFLACVFLVFGLFHWVVPSSTARSTIESVLDNYKLGTGLPPDVIAGGVGSGSWHGLHSAEYQTSQQFIIKEPLRGYLVPRAVAKDLVERMSAKGVAVWEAGSSAAGSEKDWEESLSYSYSSRGWNGHLRISCRGGSVTDEGLLYTISIQAIEIRR